MPATRALPALRYYCSAPTALSPSPCLSQRLTQPHICTLYYLCDCGSTTSRSPPMLLRLLHACYTRTTCSALLLQCTDCTLAQPLPLPTANSPTCLAHSTICTTVAPPQVAHRRCCCGCCMPATRTLPALRYYCSHRLHSPQPLPLPTANSPTCLAHSTICTTVAPPQVAHRRCCCGCCMPATRTLPALRYYCSHRLHSPQPLPLPTANSPTCLAHSTICTTAAPRLVCSPLMLLLPLHAHYLICATTDYPLNKRLPLPSQRNG